MNYNVTLSQQDLSEFLEENSDWMEQYRSELEKRLTTGGDSATVEINRNALTDSIIVDGEPDSPHKDTVYAVMDRMVNDWSWLQQ